MLQELIHRMLGKYWGEALKAVHMIDVREMSEGSCLYIPYSGNLKQLEVALQIAHQQL